MTGRGPGALARRRPATAKTHVAVRKSPDGKAVEWPEHVCDEQYHSKG